MPLLDHAGEILSETTGARRGGSGFWGDEIQVFIIGDLVKMVPVLQQLPAQVLVHLLRDGHTATLCGVTLPAPVQSLEGSGEQGSPWGPRSGRVKAPHLPQRRSIPRNTWILAPRH